MEISNSNTVGRTKRSVSAFSPKPCTLNGTDRFMKRYKRYYKHGGLYFFTVVTYHRKRLLVDYIERLRESFRIVITKMPFKIDAIVVLPDHFHCIWQMPPGDSDFSGRWMRIKKHFSIGIPAPVNKRREKQVWQPRFWEHLIRNGL